MTRIYFGEIKIGSVASGSGIFAGSNRIHKFQHASKINQAFGVVGGEGSHVLDSMTVLHDLDYIDTDSEEQT